MAVCGTAPAQPVAHAVALAGWRPLRLCCVPRTCLAAAAPPHLPAPACPTELNVVVSYDSMLNRLAWPEEPRAPWLQHACGLRRSSVPQLCRPVGACRQLLTHWQPHEGCRGAAAAAACHPAPLTALASRTHLIKLPPHSPPPACAGAWAAGAAHTLHPSRAAVAADAAVAAAGAARARVQDRFLGCGWLLELPPTHTQLRRAARARVYTCMGSGTLLQPVKRTVGSHLASVV